MIIHIVVFPDSYVLSGCFQDFLLYLWFLAVDYDMLKFVLVLYVTCLNFTELEYENWFISSNLCETFRNYPTGHWNSVDFYVFVQFSPFIFRLKNFQSIFKCFSQLQSAFKTVQWIFLFLVLFSSIIFLLFP